MDMKLAPFVARRLASAGVEVVSVTNLQFKCTKCGRTWSPNLQAGGKLPRRYWRCCSPECEGPPAVSRAM